MRFQEHYNGYDKRMRHTYNLLHKGGSFNILCDMTDIEDGGLIRMVEFEYIKYFIDETKYNLINKDTETGKYRLHKKQKYRNIKILYENYVQAVELLVKNGLIITEDSKQINNKSTNRNFDYNNICF